MKKSKVLRRCLSLILALSLVMAMSISAFASEGAKNEAVRDDRTGVVQVNVVYTGDDGERYVIQTGTGFMINELSVVTCNHVTQLDDETMEEAEERFGVDEQKLRKGLSIRISVIRDVSIGAKIDKQSVEMDFAVLKMDDKLAGCKSLPLRNSETLVQLEDCYALGFPTITTFSQDGVKLTSDDVTITDGKVSKVSTIKGVEYVVNTASVTSGNSGGPLVDENGNVVGIIQGKQTDDMSDSYSYAIASNALIETLDKFAVTYTRPDEIPAPPDPYNNTTNKEDVIASSVDKSQLSSAISQAAGMDLTKYTKESAQDLTSALENAKKVEADDTATQTAVDEAASKLNTAVADLQEAKAFPMWLIGLIAAAVIAIIVIIILMSRNSRKPAPRPRPQPMPQPAPIPPVQPQNNVPPVYPGGANTGVLGRAEDTTVLSGGSNETTVLSADFGTLTRISTGEKININKERFVIGRERGRVDYCISDNTAVGRTHAIIVNRGGSAYVIDQNSRNCTYVNDVRAGANQEVKIKSGDKITFADEAFTYNAH